MKITLIWVTVIFLSASNLFSQNKNDSIVLKQVDGDECFFIGGQNFSEDNIKNKLKENSFSHDLMSKSTTQNTWGYITLVTGGMITYYSFTGIYGSYHSAKSNPFSTETPSVVKYYLCAIGSIGIVVISISLFSSSNSNFKRAINKYN